MSAQNRSLKRRKPFATLLVGLASIVAFTLTTISFAQTGPEATSNQPSPPHIAPAIKALLIQKRDVLKRRHKNLKGLYEAGNRDYTIELVYASEMDLLNAELDLATSPDERRRVLVSQLAVRRSLEEHLRVQHELHVPDPFGVKYFKSTADRIDAEIALARETQRWLAIDRQNQMVNPSSDAKAQAAPAKPKELTVDFAPEAGAIIVTGNGKDITKAIGLLQKSDFGTSGGPRMTANFFPDLDFGHISIRGQRSDKGQIQRLLPGSRLWPPTE